MMLSRSAVKSKANALIKALESSKDTRQKIILKDVNDFVTDYPQSGELFRRKIRRFLSLSRSSDDSLSSKARQTLSLIGYAEPPNSPGLRILSIDGGGTRGLVCMEVIRQFEKVTNKRINELFDLICGVSSGAIIAMAVGSGRYTLDQCEAFYREMSEKIFKSDVWSSTPRLLLSHAYYDATIFESALKKYVGNSTLMSLASQANRPKLSAVSVNAHTVQPFIFRTYALNSSLESIFEGTCNAEIWQALRASSAAPGFFQEYKFGSHYLLDGGILVNNSTGVAYSEARALWPNESIQCVVSIGSGKFKTQEGIKANATSLYQKAHNLVYSATDTETMHLILQSAIPNYYRFNPQLSENIIISENRKLKLDQLKQETQQYMSDNEMMLKKACEKLTQTRPLQKRLMDYFYSQI